MNSTHTQTLEVITAITPMKMRFNQLTQNYVNVVRSQPNHQLNKLLKSLRNMGNDFMLCRKQKVYKLNDFPFLTTKEWKTNFTVDMSIKNKIKRKDETSNTEIKNLFMELKERSLANYSIIFTDGSKKDEKTACAFVHENCMLPEKEMTYSFTTKNTSIFVAEAAAIHQALLHCHEQHKHMKNICIASDSLSVLIALNARDNNFKKHYILGDILQTISDMLNENTNVKLLWVPSHCGINGNERADELAQMAIHDSENEYKHECHFSELKTSAKRRLLNDWQKQWNASDKGRFCYSIIPVVSKTSWFKNSAFDRKQIVFWNRIIANHTRSKESLNRFGISRSPLCNCGDGYQTVDHILFTCNDTKDEDMNKELKNLGYIEPLFIRDIIATEIMKTNKPAMNLIATAMAVKTLNLKII